jgi:hypothetical protein
MEDLNPLIDAATFGSVRRYLRAAHSPITTVMLVQHRDTLPLVGTALVAEDEASANARRRLWKEWFTSGEVRVGGSSSAYGPGINLDAIADNTLCDVLYLPPVYLVCLRGCRMPAVRRSAA